MPILTSTNIKPTVIIQPDMRFATSFLSTKFRDYAVPGEAIMDKTSGELFFKREVDGKVVSFHQNKKMLNDLVLDLRILLANNENFTYPKNDEKAFYVSTNYDIIAINNEKLYNLLIDNIIINNNDINNTNEINRLIFRVSGSSNGFFCRSSTRDCDKPFIEYMTNQYNLELENKYGRLDAITKAEVDKFKTIPKWKDSNAILTYDLLVHKNNKVYEYCDIIDYIRINEDVSVIFPESINADFPNGIDYYEVKINSIEYHKLHFMAAHKDEFSVEFNEGFNKLIFADNRVEAAEFNVISFVNNTDDILIHGNESLLAFLDIPYVNRIMSKVAKLSNSSSVFVSSDRPADYDWTANTIWAERIRDINDKDIIYDTGSASEFNDIQEFYSKTTQNNIYSNFKLSDIEKTDFMVVEI